jgi:hypothetical protein
MLRRWLTHATLLCVAFFAVGAGVASAHTGHHTHGHHTHARDSVVGHGFWSDDLNQWSFSIDATSGPNGDDPAGRMVFTSNSEGTFTASVECVNVVGNIALVTGSLAHFTLPFFDTMGFYIEDRSALGLPDRIGAFFTWSDIFSPAHACTEIEMDTGASYALEVQAGDFVVLDN